MCKITIEMDEGDPRLPMLLKVLATDPRSVPSSASSSTPPVAGAAPTGAGSPATTMTPTPTPAASPPVTMPVAATPTGTAMTPLTIPNAPGNGGSFTIDDVNKALGNAIARVKASGAKAILAEFGVSKAGELKPEQFEAVIAKLNG